MMFKTVKWMLFATLFIFSFAAVAVADTTIPASFAGGVAPSIDGIASPGEWSGATETTLTHGKMRTMNDLSYLYVLLDVTDDTVADPVPMGGANGDYFVLEVDVDRNHAVTPNVDILYSTCQDGRVFVKATHLSQYTYTGCQDTDILSLGARGFGTTDASSTPHRFWELRLKFSEIGVDPSTWASSGGTTALARMNVTTNSLNPAFNTSQPDPSESPNMTNLYAIMMALGPTTPTYPLGSGGPVFDGVGFVPSNYIISGYANIHIANYYSATDAPFGGQLNVFGHWSTLQAIGGAKKYRVLYSYNGGAFHHLLQTFTNFKYTAGTWVPASIAPDADDAYRIPDPAETWYLTNLLISWQSGGFPDGNYELRLEVLNNGGTVIGGLPSPAAGNSLKLFVDNTAPFVKINQMYYNGGSICACGIVTQGDAPRGFTFNITVTDAHGALNAWSLGALFGNNESTGSIAYDAYTLNSNAGSDGFNAWNGDSFLNVPATPFRVSKSCAYTWVLSASSRVQNGYGLIFPYVAYHQSLTTLLGTGDGSATSCTP